MAAAPFNTLWGGGGGGEKITGIDESGLRRIQGSREKCAKENWNVGCVSMRA